MFKVVILEDDLPTARELESFLNRYCEEHGISAQMTHFCNAFDFLETYDYKADVVFFDIEMPGLNGMDAAKKLREKDSQVTIVFATNLAQYAIEGYGVNALDFILKPFSYPAMELKFGRIFNELAHSHKQETITVKTKGNVQILLVADIRYVEIRNHALIYHLSDKTVSTWGSLNNACAELAEYHFSLANACYLVSLSHVRGIEGNEVVVDDEKLPISKGKRKSFLSDLALYFGGSK